MNQFIHGVVRAVAESFALPDPILEIGSYQVAGQQAVANLRPLFVGRPYVGIDVRPGPGVDREVLALVRPGDDREVGEVHGRLQADGE